MATVADVVIVGGGVAGLSAGIFTSRHDLETVICTGEGSILRRNAHLENYPGFPAGVNSRVLLGLIRDQAVRSGCAIHEETVTRVDHDADFSLTTASGEQYSAPHVIAATKNETGYLEDLEDVDLLEHGKTFVATDERGRTGLEGLYAAGRLAGKPHQAIVAAGHGAEVAVTLLEDHEAGFYHDWVAPEGYFTERGRDVPPGIEEIDEDERRRRELESMAVLQAAFEEPHPERPEMHPALR